MATFRPRPNQREVLAYTSGMMGVSAVPGSGKTWTLSQLAAKLVLEGNLEDDQEVLVVTLVNSAVTNFASRVTSFVKEHGLLPNVGYRVRTLHGLSHDIVRERPGLVGLADDFQIVDERAANDILREAALAWLRNHPDLADDYFARDLEENRIEWLRKDRWPEMMANVAMSIIKQAKDMQVTPAQIRYQLDHCAVPLSLLEFGYAVYADYQRALAYRGAVDFDDLIRLAYEALRLDPEFCGRLHHRWPYILEDEAQDSSALQERILRTLAEPELNWVRVGDPNQAIYETFTTANPKYLRDFRAHPDVHAVDLPHSGRSMPSIIGAANALIEWTKFEHPEPAVRDALDEPYIEVTPPNDPQPNPDDNPLNVRFVDRAFKPEDELSAVVKSAKAWLEENPEDTVAILVPRNTRGSEIVDLLNEQKLPYIELLRSAQATREAAGALANILMYLADPTSSRKLATVYRVWRKDERDDPAKEGEIKQIAGLLAKCRTVEDYIAPRGDRDWLDEQRGEDGWSEELIQHLNLFRTLIRRWQDYSILPIDQLVLTLAQEIFVDVQDLAITHKIAGLLRQLMVEYPDWRLPELARELGTIAKNQRKFLGFSEEDTGFDPDLHKGKIAVATMHKAKGLEWEKVYLMSVNDYNFPSAEPQDSYISEPWYIRDKLNVSAEALAQLEELHNHDETFMYAEGQATQESRYEYVAERIRLFFVGITRARKALSVTWNTGKRGNSLPSVPFVALQTWWERGGNG